jgi:hypothetical protein
MGDDDIWRGIEDDGGTGGVFWASLVYEQIDLCVFYVG